MVQGGLFGRLKLERDFHNGWARSIDVTALDPDRYYGCPTRPEVTYAIDSLGSLAGKRILDLGAGSGEASVFFTRKGAEVVVTDISPEMCKVARELARRHCALHRFHPATMAGEFLAFPDASFDLIFGEDVLHHLDQDRALPEIRRVLTEGGKAVFIEPLGHNPVLNLFRRLSPETRTQSERPLRMKDFKTIAKLFSRCRHREFQLATLLLYLWFYAVERVDPNRERYWKKIVREAERYKRPFRSLYMLDKIILSILPYLRRHCRVTVIECWK